MKCDKCGFVSFDHLAECRRCGANLEGTRERLGFSPVKAEVPFLLGALVKRGEPLAMSPAGMVREPEEPGPAIGFSPEADPTLEVEVPPDKPLLPLATDPEENHPAPQELIIELSEADLEALEGGRESPRPGSRGKSS